MTRRSDKQEEGVFWTPGSPAGEVWAVESSSAWCDDPDAHWADEGTPVVALFTTEQTAKQFAEKRGLTARKWTVHKSMKGI